MFKHDGHTRRITWEDLRAGVVIRETSMDDSSPTYSKVHPAFPDYLVVATRTDESGKTEVQLVRPYVSSHLSGTTSPSFLIGVSDLWVAGSLLVNKSYWQVVLLSTEKPQEYRV